MIGTSGRRVALVAGPEQTTALLNLFQSDALRDWQAVRTDGCEHVRFLVQMDACDVLLLDDSDTDTDTFLTCLSVQHDVPAILVSDNDPQRIVRALGQGIWQWLPRPLVLDNPSLLAATLLHASTGSVRLRQAVRTGEALRDCRGQVTRLVNLLWEAAPLRGRPRWFNQRFMLQRLHEEVKRTERHGSPLAIVLGEIQVRDESDAATPAPDSLHQWAIERISRSKRTSDVAGQYGPEGFMLVLPHTRPEGATAYCRRLRTLLQHAPSSMVHSSQRLHACLAIALHSPITSTAGTVLRQAEEQLDLERTAHKTS